jgi:hypothetical protein
MKEIERKDAPDVSGGFVPEDGGCFPPFPNPIDFPPNPIGPFPEPVPSPLEPVPFGPVK